MPAKHSLHVALTETLVRYVRDQVAAGHHHSAGDVVRTALQILMQRDESAVRPISGAALGRRRHG